MSHTQWYALELCLRKNYGLLTVILKKETISFTLFSVSFVENWACTPLMKGQLEYNDVIMYKPAGNQAIKANSI